jgi:hypothetical protein
MSKEEWGHALGGENKEQLCVQASQDVRLNVIWDYECSSEPWDNNPYAIFTPPNSYKIDAILIYMSFRYSELKL